MSTNPSGGESYKNISQTNSALSVQHLSGQCFDLEARGTPVSFDHISYDNDFEISPCRAYFTARVSGYYLVNYGVNFENGCCAAVSVCKNGEAVPGLITAKKHGRNYSGGAVVFIKSGDCVQLALSGRGHARLLENTGATLNLIKIA
jgi:hypothetical protein